MNLRPRQTAQYGLTRADKLRWGFIASTDNHAARPATGYKQYARTRMTDARGLVAPLTERLLEPFILGRQNDPGRAQRATREPRSFGALLDVEREASFMYPGGIVAVHADGRDRRAIWDALMRREVYGTSGPRMLLWFDLLNAPGGLAPMGSEARPRRRRVSRSGAVGSFVQKPGCPEESLTGLPADRLERLCRGECYRPSDERVAIDAFEIVRVRTQQPAAPRTIGDRHRLHRLLRLGHHPDQFAAARYPLRHEVLPVRRTAGRAAAPTCWPCWSSRRS